MNDETRQRLEQQVDQHGHNDAQIARTYAKEKIKAWIEVVALWSGFGAGMFGIYGVGNRPGWMVVGAAILVASVVRAALGKGVNLVDRLEKLCEAFSPLSVLQEAQCANALRLCANSNAAQMVREHALKKGRQLYGFDHQLMRFWSEESKRLADEDLRAKDRKAYCSELHGLNDPSM